MVLTRLVLAIPSVDYCLTWMIFILILVTVRTELYFFAEARGSRRLLIDIMTVVDVLTQLVGILVGGV